MRSRRDEGIRRITHSYLVFVYCRAGEAAEGGLIVVTMTDPTTLIAKLQSSFENARNAGDLYFFPSTVVTHYDSEIEVIDIIKPGLERIQAC